MITNFNGVKIEIIEQRLLFSAGQLDLTFGTGGIASTHISGGTSVLTDIQALPNGRLLACGSLKDAAGIHVVFARYLPDGQADLGFGGRNGMPRGVALSGLASQAGKIELLPKGAFLFYDSSQLAKFNADGSIDPSFTRSAFNHFKYSFSLVDIDVQSDGKILLAGRYRESFGHRAHFAVARLRSNGKRDPGFGRGGVADYYQLTSGVASAVRAMPDNSILVTGDINYGYLSDLDEYSTHDAICAKLMSNGSLDASYGNAGVASRRFRYFTSAQTAAAIAPDGTATIINYGDMSHAFRYTPNGQPDSTFGGNGVAVPSQYNTTAVNLAVRSEDKTLLATINTMRDGGVLDSSLYRFTASATADRGFGNNGVSTLNLGAQTQLGCIRFASDGSILVSVHAGNDMKVARFWSDNAPAVQVHAPNYKQAGGGNYVFTAVIRDDQAVKKDSLTASAFRVRLPDGNSVTPQLAHLSSVAGKSKYLATFKLPAPHRIWAPEDNGVYHIQLLNRRVSDLSNNLSGGRVIGEFKVHIA